MITPNWYARNATRKYPLADSATGIDDNNVRLPHGILADCQLRWPQELGRYAYVGGVTVSSRLVTVTFLATEEPDGTGGFTPLASVTLPLPVREFVNYPVTPSQPGVGGFIAFGDVSQPCAVRFSGPAQSLLVSRAAAPYPETAVTSIGKKDRGQPLTGIVTLKAGPDILLTQESLEIAGETRSAIVVSLRPSTAGRNVFELYAGQCDARPESHNCEDDGIEKINGVQPDCDGNLDIVFVGLETSAYSSCGGEFLETSLGLPDVCPPDIAAELPNFEPCDVSSLSAESAQSSVSSAGSAEPSPCGAMPYREYFERGTPYWTVLAGTFESVAGGGPPESSSSSLSASLTDTAFVATSLSRRNVALVSLCGYPSRPGRLLRTQLLLPISAGTRHNGGIVFNYHDNSGNPFYWIGSLDVDRGRLVVSRFRNGSTLTITSVLLETPAAVEEWYEMTVEITSGTSATVTLRSLTDPDWPAATVIAPLEDYAPSSGAVGLESERSMAYFTMFSAEVV